MVLATLKVQSSQQSLLRSGSEATDCSLNLPALGFEVGRNSGSTSTLQLAAKKQTKTTKLQLEMLLGEGDPFLPELL